MRGLRRFVAAGAALICVTGALAACAATVDGSGSVGGRHSTPAPTGSASGSGSAAQSGSATSSPTGFPSTSSAAPSGDVASYLVPAPAGSTQGTSSWATTTSPTVEQFVAHFYDSSDVSDELARLHADGITHVAHRLWIADQIQLDVVLLQFNGPTGAQTRHSGIVSATTQDPSLRVVHPAAPGDTTEFYDPKVDKLGNIASRAYSIKGSVTVEAFCFSPGTFAGTYLTRYTTAQLDKLP